MKGERPEIVSSAKVDSCTHCGLPVPPSRQRRNSPFCCSGCESVYSILERSGFDETYYRLRDATSKRSLSGPVRTNNQTGLLDELDTEVFLENHSTRLDGGNYRTHLYLDGVHCAACVWLVERLPEQVEGVSSARLNLPRARLSVEWSPETVDLSSIAKWLASFGYPIQPRVDGEEAPESKEERKLLIRMGVSWALAGNIMLLAFALYSGMAEDSPGLYRAARVLSLILAIPAVGYGGSVFFSKAWHSIRLSWKMRTVRHLHMDTPISIGIIAGTVASIVAVASGEGDVWFDSVSVLIAALLTARWLQLRARRMAGDSTEQLLALLPSVARRPDGKVVRADDLDVGDKIQVRPGELIPVDGTILEGHSLINASILTGESEALKKGPGDLIQAGTTNETGLLIIRIDASGHRTRVGQLLSWVGDRGDAAPALSSLGDRIGGLFTVTVLGLALIGFAFWSVYLPEEAVMHVVAFLVITCPCALGMATPLALAVGTGRAARRGIFIKSEHVVDWVSRVDTVVLDKTGTLTEGQMAVDEFIGDPSLVDAACALERDSNHPIARALLNYAETHGAYKPDTLDGPKHDVLPVSGLTFPEATGVEHLIGAGIKGQVGAVSYRIGSPHWTLEITDRKSFSESETRFMSEATAEGKTVVAVTSSDEKLALISLSDPIRPSSYPLIAELQQSGVRLLLCSGDDENTCKQIGGRLGLSSEDCLGRHTPEQKRAVVDSLISEGCVVAMIGDGVNDAAALKAAQVGIAVSGASTASRMAADAFTTRPGLEAVSELLKESDSVLRVVRRNLGFSLAYNVVGGIVALAGFVTPLFAAVAMPISSFIVVISSIRQKSFSTGRERS